MTIWYVDLANGNNANGGQSPGDAFQFIGHALTQAVANDTIRVARGNIHEASFEITIPGLTIEAFGTGNVTIQGVVHVDKVGIRANTNEYSIRINAPDVIVNGFVCTGPGKMFHITSAGDRAQILNSAVDFYGQNPPGSGPPNNFFFGYGVHVDGSADNVRIAGISFSRADAMGGDYIRADLPGPGLVIEDSIFNKPGAQSGDNIHIRAPRDSIVRRCWFQQAQSGKGQAIAELGGTWTLEDCYFEGGNFGVACDASTNIIRRCYFHGVGEPDNWGAPVFGASDEDGDNNVVQVTDCLFVNCRHGLHAAPPAAGENITYRYTLFEHNTIVDCTDFGLGGGVGWFYVNEFGSTTGFAFRDARVQNNLVVGGGTALLDSAATLSNNVINNNFIDNDTPNPSFATNTRRGTANLNANYCPPAGSPALGYGRRTSVGPPWRAGHPEFLPSCSTTNVVTSTRTTSLSAIKKKNSDEPPPPPPSSEERLRELLAYLRSLLSALNDKLNSMER